jgi:sugar lactone lactonase YvrE
MNNYVCALFLFTTMRFCSSDTECKEPTNVTLTEKWSTEAVMKTPESALYDESRRVIFVSNINGFNNDQHDGDGFISKLKPNGTVDKLDWVTGLNDPKGLAIWKNKLYVADIDHLVEININNGTIASSYPISGAVFLNDVTVDSKGTVYVSDTGGNKIYQLKGNTISVFDEDENISGPNGLMAESETLIMASAATGNIGLIDYQTKNYTNWTSGIANADGIAKDRFKNYFISNWQGEVYYVFTNGNSLKLLDTKDAGINSADVSMMQKENILLVPTFFNNRIVAYQATYE